MTTKQRDDAIDRFKSDPSVKVLLSKLINSFKLAALLICYTVSMKAGGVGLNLTVANRVILLDLGTYALICRNSQREANDSFNPQGWSPAGSSGSQGS